MPTLGGIRRRGYTPEAVRNFCRAIGAVSYTHLDVYKRQLDHKAEADSLDPKKCPGPDDSPK